MITINKQKFASYIGLVIVASHIGMTAYLWLIFQPNASKVVKAAEISMPLSATFTISVVTWFIATKGLIASDEKIGMPLVILSIMIVGSFLLALPVGPYLYLETDLSAEGLNQYYVFVESALGGMFVLIFNFMFEKGKNT